MDSDHLLKDKKAITHQISEIQKRLHNNEEIGKIIFESFYGEKSLEYGRQLIKSAAGYGLLIFMNRIKKLYANFALSTNYNSSSYGFINYYFNNEKSTFFSNAYAPGTNYNIIFPISLKLQKKIGRASCRERV